MTLRRLTSHQRLLTMSLLVCASLLALAGRADAATQRTWTGEGGNGLWSNANNWSGHVAPVAGDGVTFNTPVSTTDDIAAAISNVLFTSNAGGSKIGGTLNINALDATINIESDSAGNRIEAPISITGAILFIKSGVPGQTLTLTGAISGTAGLGVRVYGPGAVEYAQVSNNTYTGVTQVASNDANGGAGLLLLNSTTAGSLVPSSLSIGGTASGQPANSARVKLLFRDCISNTSDVTVNGDGLLDLNGLSETVASTSGAGNIALGAGTLTVPGAVTLGGGTIASTGGDLSLTSTSSIMGSGSITAPIQVNGLTSIALPINVGGATLALNGITAGTSSAVSVSKTGAGVLELDGASSYTGETDITAGTLSLAAGASLVTGGLSLSGASALNIGVASANSGGYGSITTISAPVLANTPLQVTAAPGFLAPGHSKLRLIDNLGGKAVNGTFLGLPETSPVAVGTQAFNLSYAAGTGNDVELSQPNVAPVLATGVAARPSPGIAGSPLTLSATASDADNDPLTYSWSFGDGTTGAGSTTTHTYSAPGTYMVTVSIADGFGGSVSSATSVTINQASAAPTLTGFSQAHTTWRAGGALAVFTKAAKRPPLGTRFSFTLNEAATVSLVFTHSAPGRRSGARCVAVTTKNRMGKSCKRTLTVTLSHSAHSGKNTIAFQGRISSASKLGPGHYTVTATATNSARQRSKPSSLSFTIVK
jgi:fibronectin-binding autotransporter adhesin